jgi:hypothetical protein
VRKNGNLADFEADGKLDRYPRGRKGGRPRRASASARRHLADLGHSSRDLWTFYVFADTGDPRLPAKVAEIAADQFRGAKNVNRAAAGS